MKKTEEITKEISGSEYFKSAGFFDILNPVTLKYEKKTEEGVMGRFAKVKQLNSFKSKTAGAPVYDEIIICQIKVNLETGGRADIVSHRVNEHNQAAFASRFPDAFKEFSAKMPKTPTTQQNAGTSAQNDRAYLLKKAAALGIDFPEKLNDKDLKQLISEKETK